MPVCPECFSKALVPHGYYQYKGQRIRQWKCEHCGRVTAYPLVRRPSRRRGRR
jgi:transposase-like protein